MFFKRRFLSLILALFLLAGLTSCGGPPEDAGSGPSASDLGQEAQPSDQPEDPSLSQLRRELDEGGYFCGIAFLGNLPDGDPEALPRVIREAGYLEDYPFLETLPKEQIIAYEGSEPIALFPGIRRQPLPYRPFSQTKAITTKGNPVKSYTKARMDALWFSSEMSVISSRICWSHSRGQTGKKWSIIPR